MLAQKPSVGYFVVCIKWFLFPLLFFVSSSVIPLLPYSTHIQLALRGPLPSRKSWLIHLPLKGFSPLGWPYLIFNWKWPVSNEFEFHSYVLLCVSFGERIIIVFVPTSKPWPSFNSVYPLGLWVPAFLDQTEAYLAAWLWLYSAWN